MRALSAVMGAGCALVVCGVTGALCDAVEVVMVAMYGCVLCLVLTIVFLVAMLRGAR
ncbi:MAG: hypothetical protein FWG15_02900 [Propionibacteriaceae bacterium]|nr:hypothetical protein [Propionibacteriaceae bacterium]